MPLLDESEAQCNFLDGLGPGNAVALEASGGVFRLYGTLSDPAAQVVVSPDPWATPCQLCLARHVNPDGFIIWHGSAYGVPWPTPA